VPRAAVRTFDVMVDRDLSRSGTILRIRPMMNDRATGILATIMPGTGPHPYRIYLREEATELDGHIYASNPRSGCHSLED
jgi:hypothetical protein